ncbi:isochorismatase family protein [Roseimarinus sediminis]|uniref:isochorismatase family protein n=1 Tax=Roseimarinus sediminis TaxID=1610899 RepID=UPI003D1EBED8
MRINKEQSIAVMVDVQERLFPAMDMNMDLLKKSKMLIEGLSVLEVPMLVTQQYTKGLGKTIPDLSTIIADFSPIEKIAFSCCDENAFVEALEEEEPAYVILFGIESHVCVLQTAIDLKSMGYEPVIVADAIASRKAADMAIAMERFRHEGIMVTTVESLLFELLRMAGSPQFKAISKLVK